MNPLARAVKRGVDLAVAGAGLVYLSPLMAGIALAVRLDSKGPALFRQERLGRGGKLFTLFKFRTMSQNSRVVLDPGGKVRNVAHDPRHTWFGRILRQSSLDELPQLLNVLRGEMSIVGPRPDLPDVLPLYPAEVIPRLAVRPGITGLAQVSGRNALSAIEKWRLDAEYAINASLVLDAKIIAKTVLPVFFGLGVYDLGGTRRPKAR